jgi:hypothetical protein
MSEQDQAMQSITKRIQAALDASDPTELRELLDPDVRWGPPNARNPGCKNRDQVIAWYEKGRASGVEGQVSDIEVLGDRVLVTLVVRGTDAAKDRGGTALRWQVLSIKAGLVIDIVGFDDRSEAVAFADVPLNTK